MGGGGDLQPCCAFPAAAALVPVPFEPQLSMAIVESEVNALASSYAAMLVVAFSVNR